MAVRRVDDSELLGEGATEPQISSRTEGRRRPRCLLAAPYWPSSPLGMTHAGPAGGDDH